MDNTLSGLTKLFAFQITGLIFLLNIGISEIPVNVEFCNKTQKQKHIMCKDFEPPEEFSKCKKQLKGKNLTVLTMNETEKKSIVHIINQLRDEIAAGKFNRIINDTNELLPPAASMTETIWAEDLAVAASKKIKTCTPDNLDSEIIKFGTIQAMAIHPHLDNRLTESLNESLRMFFSNEAKYFDLSKLTNYPSKETYDYFTILAHHSSLFVGCAMATPSYRRSRNISVVCYFAPSETAENNTLYKNGSSCSECPFTNAGFNCSIIYTNLCSRPSWTISDTRTQDVDFLGGFDKLATTTTSSTSTTTTTSSTSTTTTTSSTSTTTTTSSTSTTTKDVPKEIGNLDNNVNVDDSDNYLDEDLDAPPTITELTSTESSKSKSNGSSRSSKAVLSRYLPIIIFFSFLVHNKYMQ